jgi:carbon starvation protein CstA
MALFSWANQSISAIALWIGTVYLYKRKPLYHRINTSIFHNVSARVFSLYDPTIGFGLDIVTSDIEL